MKALVLGMLGIGGVGTVALVGVGSPKPDDFIAVTSKPPAEVYSAFAGLGTEGEVVLPIGPGGYGSKLVQRVVKVPGEQVKLELAVDDEIVLSAEVQLEPAGSGTKVAAELDVNRELITRAMRDAGAPELPAFALQEFLIDHVFAQAMGEMLKRIEQGEPLMSLADTHARWGSGEGASDVMPASGGYEGSWDQGTGVRPDRDPRPAIDPDAAASRPLTDSYSR